MLSGEAGDASWLVHCGRQVPCPQVWSARIHSGFMHAASVLVAKLTADCRQQPDGWANRWARAIVLSPGHQRSWIGRRGPAPPRSAIALLTRRFGVPPGRRSPFRWGRPRGSSGVLIAAWGLWARGL